MINESIIEYYYALFEKHNLSWQQQLMMLVVRLRGTFYERQRSRTTLLGHCHVIMFIIEIMMIISQL